MEVDEIMIPSPDTPGGQTFGPVTLESTWDGPVDLKGELPVAFAPERCRFFGIGWYRQIYRTRGVFSVTANRITLRPTAPVLIERAAWWRRCGYWLLARRNRARSAPADARGRKSRR
jgi:hypothetical protein